MIKGVRVEATNATVVGTQATVTNLLAIPSGKSFILTDLVVSATYAADGPTGLLSAQVFKLYDGAGDGATAQTGTTTPRLTVNLPNVQCASSGADLVHTYQRGGVTMHFTNGPAFSTGITPGLGGAANAGTIGTGCVYIAGILR